MHAIGQHLPHQFLVEQVERPGTPALRTRAGKERRAPAERLDILDEMVAANVELKIAFEERQLLGKAGMDRSQRRVAGIDAPGRDPLHPHHHAERQGVAVPAVVPVAGLPRRVDSDPLAHQVEACVRLEALQIFHIMVNWFGIQMALSYIQILLQLLSG